MRFGERPAAKLMMGVVMAEGQGGAESVNAVELAAELTIAWLSNSNTRVAADDVPGFLQSMHNAVSQLSNVVPKVGEAQPEAGFAPAVSVRKSLASKDHIVSMIDGKPYKTLRRHLATNGLTPEEYRQRYGLKPDYPMVAENYSATRSAMAKSLGLGRKRSAPSEPEPAPAPAKAAPKRRNRAKS
jgi:predicted transcriptional regulator